MKIPMTVTALLALQDEEMLREMYRSINDEIGRLEHERLQVEEALAKRSRRSPRGSGSGNEGRHSGVKRQDVLNVVRSKGQPVMPAEVRNALSLRGYNISGAAVRNHLRRLVDDGLLSTNGEGLYTLRPTSLSENGSGDPLLTDNQNQSESLI